MSELSQEHESLPAVRLVRAIGKKDWATAEALIPDDFYYETVLSNEEIIGKAAYMEFNQTFPGDWSMPIDQVVHEGNSTVIRLRFIVGDAVDHAIMFFESENGIVTKQSDWWPEFYAPPAWRAGKYPRKN
ncbi:hypothetical protein BH09CHL1_BH09CHL1_10150 [soil metagenome]